VPDIGNTLREARIRRGLTLVDVENVTKIRSKYLEALEENDFEVLPGSTVVKAFLRSYAIVLKLDPELLLHEYHSLYESHRDEIGAPFRTEIAQQRRSATSAERKKKRVRRTQRGYVGAALIAIAIIIVLVYFSARGGDKGAVVLGASNIPTTTSSMSTTTTAVDSSTTSGDSAGSTTSISADTVTTAGQNVTMVLTVHQDTNATSVTDKPSTCWMVVREDSETGAELYAGTLSAGGQQTFDTAKQYWVRAGAPQNLSVSINGTPFTVSGDAGVFLITAAGVEREQTDSTTETTG
jgi:cytoskeletal protein RodZ